MKLDGVFTCKTQSYCENRYTTMKAIWKPKSQVQRMCVEDSSCKAIDYSQRFGKGHLCTSTSFVQNSNYEICKISRGKDSYFKLCKCVK